jgi:hypothetical protein
MQKWRLIVQNLVKMANCKGQYVTMETLEDVKQNQAELIKILNHRMTKMGNNVNKITLAVVEMKTSMKFLSSAVK